MPPISLAPVSGRYLSFAEREEIAILHAQHFGIRDIARLIVLCQIRSGGLLKNDMRSFSHSGRSSKKSAVTMSRIQFRTSGNVGSGVVPRRRSNWRNVNASAAITA